MLFTFEPVNSPEYDLAAEEFRRARRGVRHGRRYRAHIAVCVSLLRDLYSKGEVENIESLPLPHDICSLDGNGKAKNLLSVLGNLYFHNARMHRGKNN
jgi:hypothetical protein